MVHGVTFILLLILAPLALAGDDDAYDGYVRLNGTRAAVHWADGDSFEFRSGPRKGNETRLIGFNTLESYGPVHRWGQWTGRELWGLSKKAGRFAASREWECFAKGKRDAYDRLLVDCPELRRYMLRRGLAHLFDLSADRCCGRCRHRRRQARSRQPTPPPPPAQ